MIGYPTFATNILDAVANIFDGVIAIMKPYDGQAVSVGNGSMVAIIVGSREKVDALYNKTIEQGCGGEGAPGQRFPNFDAAYFHHLVGNKFNAYYMGP